MSSARRVEAVHRRSWPRSRAIQLGFFDATEDAA